MQTCIQRRLHLNLIEDQKPSCLGIQLTAGPTFLSIRKPSIIDNVEGPTEITAKLGNLLIAEGGSNPCLC